ncbi:hypothetical protein [Methanothermococcus sp.]|uniref:hypothetical protein n=1 Tax=Methanothermococcus sp. TaxID=2614238 RepID=UPI0025EE37AB|nr:hypothetical protein [Methanothermococcus sp.]
MKIELIYNKEKYLKNPDKIDTLFKIDNNILGGIVKVEEGKIEGDDCNLYGFFQDILIGIAYLLSFGKSDKYMSISKEEIKEIAKIYGFPIKNIDMAYTSSLSFPFNKYIFEFNKNSDEMIIYYYNDMYIYDNHLGKKGIIKIPMKEFVKNIIKLAEDYINFIKKHNNIWKEYEINFLEDRLRDVKKYYKERYGEEL